MKYFAPPALLVTQYYVRGIYVYNDACAVSTAETGWFRCGQTSSSTPDVERQTRGRHASRSVMRFADVRKTHAKLASTRGVIVLEVFATSLRKRPVQCTIHSAICTTRACRYTYLLQLYVPAAVVCAREKKNTWNYHAYARQANHVDVFTQYTHTHKQYYVIRSCVLTKSCAAARLWHGEEEVGGGVNGL